MAQDKAIKALKTKMGAPLMAFFKKLESAELVRAQVEEWETPEYFASISEKLASFDALYTSKLQDYLKEVFNLLSLDGLKAAAKAVNVDIPAELVEETPIDLTQEIITLSESVKEWLGFTEVSQKPIGAPLVEPVQLQGLIDQTSALLSHPAITDALKAQVTELAACLALAEPESTEEEKAAQKAAEKAEKEEGEKAAALAFREKVIAKLDEARIPGDVIELRDFTVEEFLALPFFEGNRPHWKRAAEAAKNPDKFPQLVGKITVTQQKEVGVVRLHPGKNDDLIKQHDGALWIKSDGNSRGAAWSTPNTENGLGWQLERPVSIRVRLYDEGYTNDQITEMVTKGFGSDKTAFSISDHRYSALKQTGQLTSLTSKLCLGSWKYPFALVGYKSADAEMKGRKFFNRALAWLDTFGLPATIKKDDVNNGCVNSGIRAGLLKSFMLAASTDKADKSITEDKVKKFWSDFYAFHKKAVVSEIPQVVALKAFMKAPTNIDGDSINTQGGVYDTALRDEVERQIRDYCAE